MVREPPPWRNDTALLSKIASQEKLRAELPSPPSRVLLLFLFRNTLSLKRTTAWFLLQESIRWLQESKGFYVKILQKIMARYTFLQRGIALHSLSSRLIPSLFFFLTSPSVFRLDIRLLSSHLLCTSAFWSFDRITMHRECILLIASPSRSVPIRGRKLVGRKFILER